MDLLCDLPILSAGAASDACGKTLVAAAAVNRSAKGGVFMRIFLDIAGAILVIASSTCLAEDKPPTVVVASAPGKVVTLSSAEIAAVKAAVAARLKGASAIFDLGMVGHADPKGTVTVCGYVKSPKLTGKPDEKPFLGSFDKGGAFKLEQIGDTDASARTVKLACHERGIELLA